MTELFFPDLPYNNVMENEYMYALSESQMVQFEGLQLQHAVIKRFEEQTRLQSQTPLLEFRVRRHRLTASNMGEIVKRRNDHDALASRLQGTRKCMTAAMRRGHICEPVAGRAYAEKFENRINLYPCGIVVSQCSPWIAASPDRKVYNTERNPPFGLLEIKCPTINDITEVKCLKKNEEGNYELKRNHHYYYQVIIQLAVCGLEWFELYIWWETGYFLETNEFNEDVWQQAKNKADNFYFCHFI
jgi:hypothetical protein